ncbi:MAG: hypothetical protein JXA52_07720 [Planctomycetes bacterium]|nr:hypothetical protein [Planctomycetota bacterium]
MRSAACIIVFLLLIQPQILAHLCNDVFMQAKDNLAVKVDIRDGQLRIGKEAEFRVYLLNTMDREIASIYLEVLTEHFIPTVTPSPSWASYPSLQTKDKGGKKEYFTVKLQRKENLPDGQYEIKLRLIDAPKKNSKVFKTLDLNEASGVGVIPATTSVVIDGKAEREEWQDGFLCQDFYTYEQENVGARKNFLTNQPAQEKTRFRLLCDDKNLYCLISFSDAADPAKQDSTTIYLAHDMDDKPATITIDRHSLAVACSQPMTGIIAKATESKKMIECQIPFSALGLLKDTGQEQTDVMQFLLNFTRNLTINGQKKVLYWQGNDLSFLDPVIYGCFVKE